MRSQCNEVDRTSKVDERVISLTTQSQPDKNPIFSSWNGKGWDKLCDSDISEIALNAKMRNHEVKAQFVDTAACTWVCQLFFEDYIRRNGGGELYINC